MPRSVSVQIFGHAEEAENDTVVLDATDFAVPSQFVASFSASSFFAPASDADVLDTLLSGVAKLMEAQRHFADDLDLSYDCVFRYDFSPFIGHDIRDVLIRWAKIDKARLNALLPMIFEDLSVHQLALRSAMDSVTRRAIKYLSPEYTKGGDNTVNQTLVPVWKNYCERHQRVSTNPRLRQEVLIAPGLARKYVRIREKYYAKKTQILQRRTK